MRKLIKKLTKWNLTRKTELNKWQREVLFEFITNHVTDCDIYNIGKKLKKQR